MVMPEERKRRPGQVQDGVEVLAAGAGNDGVARALMTEEHVERRGGEVGVSLADRTERSE